MRATDLWHAVPPEQWLLLGTLVLVCVALGAAVLSYRASQILRRSTGLISEATVVASDTEHAVTIPMLTDPVLGLYGRPDLVLDHEGVLVPVEVKSRLAPVRPYLSDIMQLMVYLRLLRASYGPRASAVGLIRYRDRSFEVRLTPKREAELVRIIEAIRAIRAGRLVGHRGHEVPAKCRGCAMYDRCDERLVSPIRE